MRKRVGRATAASASQRSGRPRAIGQWPPRGGLRVNSALRVLCVFLRRKQLKYLARIPHEVSQLRLAVERRRSDLRPELRLTRRDRLVPVVPPALQLHLRELFG